MQRQLGIIERFVWSCDREILLHFSLTAKIVGEIDLDQLRQALTRVQQKHPLLRVGIVEDEFGQPWFIEQDAFIPVRIVQRRSDQHWLSEVEQELWHPFEVSQAPLIRMVLVYAQDISELILTCHHSIGDGLSTAYLFKHILQAIAFPNDEQQTLPEYPSLEDMMPEFIEKIGDDFRPNGKNFSGAQRTMSLQDDQRLLAWFLSPVETAALIDMCHQEQTTVHAAICAAFIKAFQQHPTNEQQHNQEYPIVKKCLSPVNVRRFLLNGIAEDFGCYFVLSLTKHPFTPDMSLWDLARSIKLSLNQQITSEAICQNLLNTEAFLTTLSNKSSIFKAMEKTHGFDVMVSNLGRLNIPVHYGHLRLEAMYGPSLIPHFKNNHFLGVITLGDKMFFNLVYSELDIKRAQVERVKQEAMKLLLTTNKVKI